MNESYFTFRSLTSAQNASNILKHFGIAAQVVSTPAALSAEGCGYSVSVKRKDLNAAKAIFRQKMIPYRQILSGKKIIAGSDDGDLSG